MDSWDWSPPLWDRFVANPLDHETISILCKSMSNLLGLAPRAQALVSRSWPTSSMSNSRPQWSWALKSSCFLFEICYDKLSIKTLVYCMEVPYKVHKFKLSFCTSQANELSITFGLSWISSFFSIISPWKKVHTFPLREEIVMLCSYS